MINAEVFPDTYDADLEREKYLRLSGVKSRDLLRAEIIKGNKKPNYYEHLSRSLGFQEIKEMTKVAMQYDNTKAVMAMLKTNLYAATSALSTNEGAEFMARQVDSTEGSTLIQMFFMVRTVAPLKYRILLRRITRNIILKTSLKIAGRGMEKGMKRKRVPYYPGMSEFDLDLTIRNLIESGRNLYQLTYRDIVGIERTQIKKNVVLILDVSGSMYGRSLLNAALTTSVLSYIMDKHNYAVIMFHDRNFVMKNIKEKIPVVKIIDQILDTEAQGFTNIENGLKRGLKELNNIKGRQKFGILVTDGNYNRGDDPWLIAKDFPKLHVVGMPPGKNQYEGLKTCKKIANAGRGHFYPVTNHYEIPRAIMKILHSH